MESVSGPGQLAGRGITDENIADAAPFVRALVVSRLEQAWTAIDPHLRVQENPETGLVMRPDPRFLEAGLRVLDRLMTLYRLGVAIPRQPTSELDGREALIAQAQGQLAELEARTQDPKPGL